MSEPKLCPMSFNQNDVGGKEPNYSCLQEKCAWWIKDVIISDRINPQTGYRDEFDKRSHCVALDWGRG